MVSYQAQAVPVSSAAMAAAVVVPYAGSTIDRTLGTRVRRKTAISRRASSASADAAISTTTSRPICDALPANWAMPSAGVGGGNRTSTPSVPTAPRISAR
ncbi:hypothetical protein ACFQS1_27425 [Paractinoplanes rhizophilus]|uniref:Uncharacterized protein n=1 Tax=Paractinoplanes rhizophilus TaxID=1416877 RepID=A0ABW2HXC4_9ACTN|nr:hypothetical protein [Actinoplanes sp.]